MRIWGNWSDNDDITSYAGQASGNDGYTAGNGWDQVCHTFSTSDGWQEGNALVIQARLYSSSSATSAVQYFIDLVSIGTNSNSAIIYFPN